MVQWENSRSICLDKIGHYEWNWPYLSKMALSWNKTIPPKIVHSTKMACLLFLIFLRVPMTSHSFHNLFSLHNNAQTIQSNMLINTHLSGCHVNCPWFNDEVYNELALFSKMSTIRINFYFNANQWSPSYPRSLSKCSYRYLAPDLPSLPYLAILSSYLSPEQHRLKNKWFHLQIFPCVWGTGEFLNRP